MPKIIGYVRVSTDRQDLSVEAQHQRIVEYCARAQVAGEMPTNVDIVWLIDRAASGKTQLFQRPEGSKILAHAEAGDHLVFYKLDRVFRSMIDLCESIERFDSLGILPHCVHQRIDIGTPSGRLFLQVLTAVAEFERSLISERTTEALRQVRKKKMVGLSVPIGWKRVPRDGGGHILVPDYFERKVVDYIELLMRLKYTAEEIRVMLQAQGITRNSKMTCIKQAKISEHAPKSFGNQAILSCSWHRIHGFPNQEQSVALRDSGHPKRCLWRKFFKDHPYPTCEMPEEVLEKVKDHSTFDPRVLALKIGEPVPFMGGVDEYLIESGEGLVLPQEG